MNTIVKIKFGSHLYGTSTPLSDTDQIARKTGNGFGRRSEKPTTIQRSSRASCCLK